MLTSFQSDTARAHRKGRPIRPTLADCGIGIEELRYCGRLDRDSEGLLLLTTDGPFIQAVHNTTTKTYWAQVDGGVPTEAALDRMRAGGLQIRGTITRPPVSVRRVDNQTLLARLPPPPIGHLKTKSSSRNRHTTSWIEVVLREGRNRQVRRITKDAGHTTVRLVRVAIGAFSLLDHPHRHDDLLLSPGEWKHIHPEAVLSAGKDH